jgi:hypothetical protein
MPLSEQNFFFRRRSLVAEMLKTLSRIVGGAAFPVWMVAMVALRRK